MGYCVFNLFALCTFFICSYLHTVNSLLLHCAFVCTIRMYVYIDNTSLHFIDFIRWARLYLIFHQQINVFAFIFLCTLSLKMFQCQFEFWFRLQFQFKHDLGYPICRWQLSEPAANATDCQPVHTGPAKFLCCKMQNNHNLRRRY